MSYIDIIHGTWHFFSFQLLGVHLRDSFLGKPIKGCVFHWNQAVWHQVQQVGLSSSVKESTSTSDNWWLFHFYPWRLTTWRGKPTPSSCRVWLTTLTVIGSTMQSLTCRRGVSSSRPSGQTMMLKVIIFSNHVKYEILGTWKYKCVCTMQCQEQTSLEIKNYPCNIKPVI